MRRAVALMLGVLLLAGCSSTVDGRAETDAAAVQAGRTATGSTTATDPSDPAAATVAPDTTTAGTPDTTDATPDTSTGAPDPVTSGPPPPPAGTPPVETTPAPELPPGFYGADTDLGYRPMTTDEFDCTPDQTSGCFGIMVFSGTGCPPGARVTVGIFDKAVDPTNPIGSATGVTPAIAPDGTQAVVIADSTGVAGQLTARVQSVTC